MLPGDLRALLLLPKVVVMRGTVVGVGVEKAGGSVEEAVGGMGGCREKRRCGEGVASNAMAVVSTDR